MGQSLASSWLRQDQGSRSGISPQQPLECTLEITGVTNDVVGKTLSAEGLPVAGEATRHRG